MRKKYLHEKEFTLDDEGRMKKPSASERLLAAVRRAVDEHDAPNRFGLLELEIHHGGPAAGSAGGVVRKWPAEGLYVGDLRLRWEKVRGRSEIVVDRVLAELTVSVPPG